MRIVQALPLLVALLVVINLKWELQSITSKLQLIERDREADKKEAQHQIENEKRDREADKKEAQYQIENEKRDREADKKEAQHQIENEKDADSKLARAIADITNRKLGDQHAAFSNREVAIANIDDEVRQPAPPVSKQIPALELAQAPKQAISGSGECISVTHAGCFRSDKSYFPRENRVRKKEPRLSPSLCASLCVYESRRTGIDFSFMALQYGTDCYCGQSYDKLAVLDGARCNRKCGGDTTKCGTDSTASCLPCGGFDANSVYAIGDSLCNIASAFPLLSQLEVAPQKEAAQLTWNHWHKWNSKPVSSTNPLIQGEREFKAGLGGTSALRSVECCA
jgi:hypothetical protein